MNLQLALKGELARLGFPLAGLTLPARPAHFDVYRAWVENGQHAEMAYLSSEQALLRREDPRTNLPGSGTVIVVGLPYANPASLPVPDFAELCGRVAAYAWGADYHDLIQPRLASAAQHLSALLKKSVRFRAYTDTGPILERDLAQAAGLGWIGKNTCLIAPGLGSFFLLGELFVEADLEPDPPFTADRCGSCRRCIDACPTGCIRPDRTLDARRCISYLTIENKGSIPPELRPALGSWVFGCDICQIVCPWNQRFAHLPVEAALQARPEVANPQLLNDLTLTPQTFNQKFRGSPLKRAKRRGYLRNIAVALGNSGRPEAAPALAACLLEESEPLVRAHAAWGLGRLPTPAARTALEKAKSTEMDAVVQAEIQAALAGAGSTPLH